MRATEGSRNQEQAEEAVFQLTPDNEKQIQANVAQEIRSYRPEDIRPDSAPASGDARPTSGDVPATSSLRDSQEHTPTGTMNAPAVFLEKMEPPRVPSTDEELMASKTSPAPGPDAPQGTAPREAATAKLKFTPLDNQSFLYVHCMHLLLENCRSGKFCTT
jgi:hypothetical protein